MKFSPDDNGGRVDDYRRWKFISDSATKMSIYKAESVLKDMDLVQ
jgi:hypothetical protein